MKPLPTEPQNSQRNLQPLLRCLRSARSRCLVQKLKDLRFMGDRQKLAPFGEQGARVSGALLIATAGWMLIR